MIFSVIATTVANLEVGDKICIEGYIMDFFCINRGRLLDRGLKTLEFPHRHSLHCLLDVGSCINDRSPFEILIDPKEEGALYSRGFQLTDKSKQDMMTLARRVGSCSTCDNNYNGQISDGFRAVVNGEIVNLNLDNDDPPIIEAIDMEWSNNLVEEDPCVAMFNMTNVIDDLGDNVTDFFSDEGADVDLRAMHLLHGSLMLIAWGFLLPLGAMTARFFKHRPDSIWFDIHKACQIFGLLLACVGWGIALVNFTALNDIGFHTYRHAVCGMVTMVLGLLQPLNAILRPHPPAEGESKTKFRSIWEIVHKGSGYLTLALAGVTIILGTLSLPDPKDQTTFQTTYIVGCLGGLVLVVSWMMNDKKKLASSEDDGKKRPSAQARQRAKDDINGLSKY